MSHTPFWDFFQNLESVLLESPQSIAIVYFDELEQFQCSQCAACCKHPWQISVSQEYYEKWSSELKKNKLYPNAFQIKDSKNTEQDYAHITKKNHNSHCVFLQENQLCFLHESYGAAAKPRACQIYPRKESILGESYITLQLLGSCRTAPQYLESPHHLKYQLQKFSSSQSPKPKRLQEISNEIFLTQSALMYFQALSFELLKRDCSPIQSFIQLTELLARLIKGPKHTIIDHTQLKSWAHPKLSMSEPHAYNSPSPEWFSYFLSLAPKTEKTPQIKAHFKTFLTGGAALTHLSPKERKDVNLFLRQILYRKLLSYQHASQAGLNLIQAHVMIAYSIFFFQAFLYGYTCITNGTLNHKLIHQALNMSDTFLHNTKWHEDLEAKQLDMQTCLTKIQFLLQFDLSLPLYHI